MTKRMKKYSGRVASTAAVSVVLGLLLWAILAYAGAGVNTNKTQYGRNGDSVISTMSGGIASGAYTVEYYGPSVDDGTDLVLKTTHTSTADTNGTATDTYTTQPTDTSGAWEVRYLHNPNKTNAGLIVMDSPAMGTRPTAGSSVTLSFHVVDRNGNTVTTNHSSDLSVNLRVNNKTIKGWRNTSPSGSGWSFSNGVYSKSYTTGANGDVLTYQVSGSSSWSGGAAETGDAWAMGALTTTANWIVGTGTSTLPYYIVSYGNPKEVDTPDTGVTYLYKFDMYNYLGNPITSYTGTWTRSCREAASYDGAGTQTSVTTGTVSYTGGHWQWAVSVPAPGKWTISVKAGSSNSSNTPIVSEVINFTAEKGFMMLGDTTPPAEVGSSTATPGDNKVDLSWSNPGDSDFRGVIITYNTSGTNIDLDTPNMGQTYNVNDLFSNGSRVVYKNDGGVVTTSTSVGCVGTTTTMTQGGCGSSYQLPNNIAVYYKLFTYDTVLNYSAGTKKTATPFDTTPPGPVTSPGFTEGNQQVTITWTYPNDCDIKGAKISYRNDTWPSYANGSDCQGGSSNQKTTTGATAGGPGSYLHTNLVNGLTYYYTIWAYDDDGNVVADAQGVMTAAGAVPHDTIPPAAVDDLRISTQPGAVGAFNVALEWSSVGTDGRTGQAYKYDIRYANKIITENTDDATHISWKNAWHTVGALPTDPKTGVASGTYNESYTVAGLAPLTEYYFAIKTEDKAGNWSPISTTTPTATTLCNQEISACNQCHLLPPDDDLPGAHPRGTGNIGSHYLPIHAGNGTSPEQCNVCHDNGQVWRNNTTLYKYTHQNDVIDMNNASTIGNLKERQDKTGGTWHPMTTIIYKYKNYSSGVGYKTVTGYCSNTYCHGSGLSSPLWGLGSATCGEYCHETPPATGRHVKHYHPGLKYINFAANGTQVSGYDNDNGTTTYGWNTNIPTGYTANADMRYATYVYSSNAIKTFTSSEVPNGTYYLTFCVGKADGSVNNQTVSVSTDGGSVYVPLIDNFGTSALKLFKKAVDHQVIVYGNNGLKIKIGNNIDNTYLNFMILNPTPEAPKSNTTLLQNTATEYGFACGKCHVQDLEQAKHTSHVNGAVAEGVRTVEVFFDGNSLPKNPLGNYTNVLLYNISSRVDGQGFRYTVGRSCTNLYCHGNTLGANGSNETPQWKDGFIDVQGASICGSCHDAGYADSTPTTNIATGSHDKHVNRGLAYRFDCAKCHNHTVGFKNATTGIIHITDKTHHVNGDVDVIFDPNDQTMSLGHYSTAIKTCYNVYCHSNGLLNRQGVPFWATTYREPVWNSGSKSCNYCHGTGGSTGMPQYSNLSSTPNSHDTHVVVNGQGCSTCHNDTTRDNGLTIYTTARLHVDGEIDVTFNGESKSLGGYYTRLNATCANTYCHKAGTPRWGRADLVNCGSCHGNFAGNPNPASGGTSGAHNAHNISNYTAITSSVANKSTATNYDFTCSFCHYTRTHGGGEFKVHTSTAETNFNTNTPVNGYNNTGAAYVLGATILSDGTWKYTNGKCYSGPGSFVKCHSDGKGGVPNNTFYTWTSHFTGCKNCHNGNINESLKMSTGAHGKHIGISPSIYQYKCGDCHSDTATNNNLTNKANHVNGKVDVAMDGWGGSYSSPDCSNVSCHSNGGEVYWSNMSPWYATQNWNGSTSCLSCHGNTHTTGGTGDGVRTADSQTLSPAHGRHLNEYGARIGCTNCHNMTAINNTTLRPDIPTTHNNGGKDVVFWTSSTAGTGTRRPFYNMTGPNTANPQTGYWGQTNYIAYQAYSSSMTCTVICHSTGRGTDPVRMANWSSTPSTFGCNSCHPADAPTFLLPNYTSANAHATHLSNGVSCETCHRLTAGNSGGVPFINASGYAFRHVNGTGANDVKFKLGVPGSYNTATKTCSALTCHGDRAWPNHYAANCYSCHNSPPRYAQHFAHYSAASLGNLTGVKANSVANGSTATNYMFGCGKCHTLTGANPIHHNQGNVSTNQTAEVLFDATVNPMNPLAKYTTVGTLLGTDERGKTYTNGTCRTTYCHSNGQSGINAIYSSIKWSTTSVTCTSCHSGAAAKASVKLSAPHNTHVGTDFNNIACIRCHKQTVSSNTAIQYKFNHVNGVRDVSFQAFGGVTGFYTGTQCRNTYCHSDGNGGTAATLTWSATTTTCTSCHNYTAGSGSPITTGKHGQHINGGQLGNFGCGACHDKTADGGTIKYAVGYHVNGTKNVNYTTIMTNISGFYVSASKTCRNNYCHSSGQASSGTLPNRSTPVFRVTSSWGSANGFWCNSCHGKDSGQSSFGEPNYTNRSTASRAWFNSHGNHVKSSADCQTCHNSTVDATGTAIIAGGKHINGSRDVNFKNGGSYNTVTKRCSGVSCHVGTIRWGGRLANDCQSCHADMGAGTYANHSSSGKHSKHTNAATYAFACENCHVVRDPSGNITHAGGDVSSKHAAEVKFRTTSTVWKTTTYGSGGTAFRFIQMNSMFGASGSPVYTPATTMTAYNDPINSNRKWTQGRCANLWCHSNANPVGGANAYQTYANWSTAETTNCRSCHAGDATASPTISSGKHTKHINDGNLGNFGCKACHNLTVSSNTAISNYMNHVNGAKNVNFVAIMTNITGGYSATRTCRNNYCHSSGQASSGTLPNRSTPLFRTAAAWDGATTYTCNACHGQDAGASTYGQPNYTNRSSASRAWFNGHYVSGHVSSQASCFSCHANTVSSDGITVLANGNHLNGFRNVSFTLGGKYDTVNKRCSNTDSGCHGATVMRWGGTGTCDTCHQVTTAETDNYLYGSGSAKATVNYYEYTSVGHGKIGNYRYTGNAGAANSSRGARQITSCTSCHTSAVAHNTPTNPFRLTNGDVDAFCGTCHTTAQANHHSASVVTGDNSTWVFTPKCIDCHDPHGDADPSHAGRMNYAMIQGYVNYTSNSTTTYGVPTYDASGVPTLVKAVSFPANVTQPVNRNWTSYVTSGFTGICQICHTRGNAPTSPDWYNRSKFNTLHNNNLTCGQCHTHPTGFSQGGTCSDCHQTTAAETNNFAYGDSTKSTVNFYEYTAVGHGKLGRYRYSNNTGAAATLNVSRKISSCTSCHDTNVAHNMATNPFRLISSGTQKPSSPDTFCGYCHTVSEASSHKFGVTTSNATWVFTPKCVDCHDPHGDTGANGRKNNAMVQGFVNYSANSNTYGAPALQTKAVSFPANVTLPAWSPGTVTLLGYSSYATNTQTGGSYTGICQICHTRGNPPTSPDWFARDKNKTVHNNNQSCGQCHKHSTGFSRTGNCQDCHQTTGTEADDFVYNNGTKASINFYEYTAVGHGKLGKYRYTNNTGAANPAMGSRQVTGCTTCHSSTVNHGSATDPFRTISSGTVRPTSPDTLCRNCHSASQAFRHSSSISGTDANWLFFPKCIDCHDPHGDTGANGRKNNLMIQGLLNYTTNSSTYGVPAGTNGSLRRPMSFPASVVLPVSLNRTAFVVNVMTGNAYTGLCQVCHTRGNKPNSPDHFNRNTYDNGHNTGQVCDTCHQHDTGFAGAGGTCDGCHGITQDTTTETDDFAWNNSTQAKINMLQYTSVGHGKLGRYRYSNNTGAGSVVGVRKIITCTTACHDQNKAHGLPTNPFRFYSGNYRGTLVKPTDPNTLCASCHTTGEANIHSSATVSPTDATWLFTPKCVDCHDPHGDADPNHAGRMNAYMIQSMVNYTTNSDVYGRLTSPRKAVSFPANAVLPSWTLGTVKVLGYTSFATNTISGNSYTGLCQVCHTRGSAPTSPLWFGRDKNRTAHNNGTSCESCHTHSAGLSGSASCETCHQTTSADTNDFTFDNGTKATVNYDEYTSVGHGKVGTYRYSNSVGAANSSKGARQVTGCLSCHTGSTSHGASSNPFRLTTAVPDSLCTASCHSLSTTAHHNQANTGGNANWIFTPKCVDCHDPHGDTGTNGRHNNYMIQGLLNYSSNSSTYGVPTYTKPVNFPANVVLPANLNYTSYANNRTVGNSYSGLCQICHTRGAGSATSSPNHYNRSRYEDQTGHAGGAVCTNCHTHDTGFQGAGDCVGCHSAAQGTRRAMSTDFGMSSHHISGAFGSVTKTDCSACHAEGNYADGSTNSTYHRGVSGWPVYLKQWTGSFPTSGSNGTFSVISTRALMRSVNNTYVLTPFCLGCHNDTNKNATPFHDGNSPTAYSWDYNSVGSKYSNISTTPWGKFNSSTYNVVPADTVTKAFSAHGNATNNQMAKSVATFNSTNMVVATSNVQCYDCHNSHGSSVANGTSYTSANTAGGIIYAASGRNGATYTPAAGGGTGTKNVYSASSDLCFDCHLGESGTGEPKNYRTYGVPSGKAIVGYYERVGISNFNNYSTSRWSTSDVWRGSFAYKDGTFKGGHFGKSMGYMQESDMGTGINGNCTACHDPHGVSPAIRRGYSKPVATIKGASTTGGVTLSGTYSGAVNNSTIYVVQIVAGGAKGTATYKSSSNGGKTWGSATSTNTNYTATGITATFATGNYTADDTWTWLAGANPDYMVPSLKGTWMHSPYKEDRAPRKTYTSDKGANEATARLANFPKADDYTDYQTTVNPSGWYTARRLWDDSTGGTSNSVANRYVGGPAPRGNPDFRTGSYVPGYNIPNIQGDGFGRGPIRNYGYTNNTSYKGWNGYFIDENTFGTFALKTYGMINPFRSMTGANPNAMPGNFAGLCLQCHAWDRSSGIALDNVTSANLASGSQRVQTKPHESVFILGGITVNLFQRLQSAGTYSGNNPSWGMHMANYIGQDGTYYHGPTGTIRGSIGTSDPTAGGQNRAHYYRWGVNGSNQDTNGTVDGSYHRFPCSKCHTPHVSRLPRLMKTNCLDNDNVGTAHTTMGYVNNNNTPNTTASQLWGALARNVACHSTKVGAVQTSSPYYYPGGWNNKTPW